MSTCLGRHSWVEGNKGCCTKLEDIPALPKLASVLDCRARKQHLENLSAGCHVAALQHSIIDLLLEKAEQACMQPDGMIRKRMVPVH